MEICVGLSPPGHSSTGDVVKPRTYGRTRYQVTFSEDGHRHVIDQHLLGLLIFLFPARRLDIGISCMH